MTKDIKPIQYIQRNRSHRRKSLSDEVEIFKEIDRLLEPKEQRRGSNRVRILEDLDQLFKHESRWTKGTFARNRYGKRVVSRSYDASSYCLLGGLSLLERRYPTVALRHTLNSLRYLANRMMPNLGIKVEIDKMLDARYCIMMFNDARQTNFVHIKQLISRALQQARSESQVQTSKPRGGVKQATTKASPLKSENKSVQGKRTDRLSARYTAPKPEPTVKPRRAKNV